VVEVDLVADDSRDLDTIQEELIALLAGIGRLGRQRRGDRQGGDEGKKRDIVCFLRFPGGQPSILRRRP
jgi:hypothetical protein